MAYLYKVGINEAIRVQCKADDLQLKKNDWCIIRDSRYEDYGRVTAVGLAPDGMDLSKLAEVKRQATLVDQGKANENNVRSKSLRRKAEERIAEHDLPMRVVSSHLSFDRNLAIFVFTAPTSPDRPARPGRHRRRPRLLRPRALLLQLPHQFRQHQRQDGQGTGHFADALEHHRCLRPTQVLPGLRVRGLQVADEQAPESRQPLLLRRL
jgi:hypothetical protein